MNMERVEDLWTRFLAEGRLSTPEEEELLRALQADPALRRRLIQDKQFDGLLDAVNTADQDADAFAKSFQDRLAVEGDESKFIAQVEEKIRHVPARKPRPPAAGVRPESARWTLALVAAGIFAALVLTVMLMSSESPAPVVKNPERPKILVPDPVPPLPEDKPAIETPRAPDPPKAPKPVPPVLPEPKPTLPPPPPPAPPKNEEKPSPLPPIVPPEPKEKPAPPPDRKVTEVIVARVSRVEGEVSVQVGQELSAGRGVETGSKSSATVVYPDATRLELGAQTAISDLLDAKGKTLAMEKGVLFADVVKQPQGQPMVLKTPHAEIRVLGTTLRVTIDPTSTRLDVLSGKVRLTRLLDGKYVDVISGHYAVAGAGMELAAKSSAPKPKGFLLQETFQDPRGVDARWKTVGPAALLKTAGQLDIDLSAKPPSPDGWSGAGLVSRQAFAQPMAVSLDVDVPVLHGSVVAALVFIPQGQKRGAEGVFRLQLRGTRYSITTESGEARDLTGADRAGAAPGRERWKIEVDGSSVRFLVNDAEILRHKHELPLPQGYSIEIDGSARTDAPSGARVGFDNIVVEPLK